MTADETLRCTNCGETNPDMLEHLKRPLWAADGPQRYFCEMCGREFTHVPDRGAADVGHPPTR